MENTSLATKVELRRSLLTEVSGPLRILDCFAGQGAMWQHLYRTLPGAEYLGLEKRSVPTTERCVMKIDNIIFLGTDDLSRWNVFDLDAFGSPWEQWALLSQRRRIAKGERIAVFFTDGTEFTTRMGNPPTALRELVGIPLSMGKTMGNFMGKMDRTLTIIPGCHRHAEQIRVQALRCGVAAMGGDIHKALVARGKRGSGMFYGGVVIKKKRS